MHDIKEIILKFFDGFIDGGCVLLVYLCPASHAWAYQQSGAIKWHMLLEPLHQLRAFSTRSNQAHLAMQHIIKLWNFIDMCFSQNKAHPGCSPVVFLGPLRLTVCFCILAHRSKFINIVQLTASTHPNLLVEDWAASFQQNCHGDERE